MIVTTGSPAAIGPYSQAIRAGGLIFLSGQIPIDPATGGLVEGDVSAQTAQVLKNIEDASVRAKVKQQVTELAAGFPLHKGV